MKGIRVFNGEKYHLKSVCYTAKQRDKDIKRFRGDGYLIRITKQKQRRYKDAPGTITRYNLWARRK